MRNLEEEDEEASGWVPSRSQNQRPICIKLSFFLISFPCPSVLGRIRGKNSFGMRVQPRPSRKLRPDVSNTGAMTKMHHPF